MQSNIDLSKLNSNQGFAVKSISSGDSFGSSVNCAGDINGDGIDDLIVGAPNWGTEGLSKLGKSYVIFGNNYFTSFDLNNIDGHNGFIIEGISVNNNIGTSVNGAGDINNDGIDDIIVGGRVSAHDVNAAEAYVLFGKKGDFQKNIQLKILDGTNGFTITGKAGSASQIAVSGIGDVNGDNIDDFVVGMGVKEEAYVIFGKNIFTATYNITALDGTNGFTIYNSPNAFWVGASVTNAGDINKDGINDIVIGMAPPSSGDKGEVAVIYGSDNVFAPRVNAAAGFVVIGNGGSGGCDGGNLGWSVGVVENFLGINKTDIILAADKNGWYACGGIGACCYKGLAGVVFNEVIINNYNSSIPIDSIMHGNGVYEQGPSSIFGSDDGGFARSIGGGKDMTGDGLGNVLIGDTDINAVIMWYYNKTANAIDSFLFSNGVSNTGKSVASCDLDNDGIADAVIGADDQIYILYGKEPVSPIPPHGPTDHSNVNVGAIVGGIVGGVVTLGIGCLAYYGKLHGWWCSGNPDEPLLPSGTDYNTMGE